MKRVILFFLFSLLLAVPVFAQMNTYGVVGGGAILQDGESKAGYFAGGDTKIMFDSIAGTTMYLRSVIFYSQFDSDYQGLAEYFMTQKRLGILRDLYLAIGPGFYYRVTDGADEQNLAIRLSVGSDFLGNVGIDIGADYIPSIPVLESGDVTTRWFFYGSVNMYPRL